MQLEARMRRFALLFTAASVLKVIPVMSQDPAAPKKPSFEVVSIKPRAPGTLGGGNGPGGDRFQMPNATLQTLLAYAYRGDSPLLANQIIRAPNWWEQDRFDIQAKADCSGGPITAKQLQLMVQSLLEGRFQLKAHLEQRELPIYNLVVGKSGPTIKRSKSVPPSGASSAPKNVTAALCISSRSTDAAAPPPGLPNWADKLRGIEFDPSGLPPGALIQSRVAATTTLRGVAVSIADLLGAVQLDVDRPIVDRTGLAGLFDFKLEYSAERQRPPAIVRTPQASGVGIASDPVPWLQAALQQQLGLKLESTKGPVDVLVIDSVQKPSAN